VCVQTDSQVHSTDRLILDLIYLEDRWKIHWRRQIHQVVREIPTLDQKILRKTKSVIPPKEQQIPIHRNSTCWHTFDTHVIFEVIIFQLSDTHTSILAFLKHSRPESTGRADWPGTLWIQTRTLPYWRGVTTKTRTSFLERGQFYARLQVRSLPGTTKAKLASLLHANYQRWEMPHKDPEGWLVAELALRCCRLRERFPGAPTLAMSRKQAWSGCRLWPHQLLDGS
jgi:hypothetical protein